MTAVNPTRSSATRKRPWSETRICRKQHFTGFTALTTIFILTSFLVRCAQGQENDHVSRSRRHTRVSDVFGSLFGRVSQKDPASFHLPSTQAVLPTRISKHFSKEPLDTNTEHYQGFPASDPHERFGLTDGLMEREEPKRKQAGLLSQPSMDLQPDMLLRRDAGDHLRHHGQYLYSRLTNPETLASYNSRRILADSKDESRDKSSEEGDDDAGKQVEVVDPRERVAALQMQLESKLSDIASSKKKAHFLKKAIAFKHSQEKLQQSENKLRLDEGQGTAQDISNTQQRAEKIEARHETLRKQEGTMEKARKKLLSQMETVIDSKNVLSVRLQQLTVEDVLNRHARNLPDSMAGALKRSADVLTPFFDTLAIAADTNQRLVDHVGSEIDKYTHVNVKSSPFLSGILFYIVLLVPTMTIVSFIRRILASTSKLTVSHYVILGNFYFIVICFICLTFTTIAGQDAAAQMYRKHERVFITFNLSLAVYFFWHICMLVLQALYTWERRNWAQVLATLSVGIHYYVFTWRRIFINTSPTMMSANYLIYCTIFAFITFERYRRILLHNTSASPMTVALSHAASFLPFLSPFSRATSKGGYSRGYTDGVAQPPGLLCAGHHHTKSADASHKENDDDDDNDNDDNDVNNGTSRTVRHARRTAAQDVACTQRLSGRGEAPRSSRRNARVLPDRQPYSFTSFFFGNRADNAFGGGDESDGRAEDSCDDDGNNDRGLPRYTSRARRGGEAGPSRRSRTRGTAGVSERMEKWLNSARTALWGQTSTEVAGPSTRISQYRRQEKSRERNGRADVGVDLHDKWK